MPELRLCQLSSCNQPLFDAHHSRRYHPGCKKIILRERNKVYEASKRIFYVRKDRNLMPSLGLDYVNLKLSGQIHVPKGRS